MNLSRGINLNDILSKFLIYALIIYTFFILGRSIWKNYQLKQQTRQIETQIDQLKKKNIDLENLIIYYQSPSFREVQARQKLGLKKPDEKVVNIPLKNPTNFQNELEAQQANIAETQKPTEPTPNWQLWWRYIFK